MKRRESNPDCHQKTKGRSHRFVVQCEAIRLLPASAQSICCLLLGIAFTISLRTRVAGGIGVPRYEHWLTINNRRVFMRNLNHHSALEQLCPDLVPLLHQSHAPALAELQRVQPLGEGQLLDP